MSSFTVISLQRNRIKSSLTRHYNCAVKLTQDGDREAVASRLQVLEEAWAEFLKLTDAVYQFHDDPGFKDPEEDFANYEDKYIKCRSILQKLNVELKVDLPANSGPEPQTTSVEGLLQQQNALLQNLSIRAQPSLEVPLPKMEIQSFSGQYKDWPAFSNLFNSAIGSKSTISNVNKFHYLKSYLKGEASNVIAHLPSSDESFDIAWDRLKERYERPKRIVNDLLNLFINLPSLLQEDEARLRKVSDGANEVIKGLEAIEQTGRDCWLIHILLAKLDCTSQRKWVESTLNSPYPTIEEFLSFIEQRCDEIELSRTEKGTAPKAPKSEKLTKSKSFTAISQGEVCCCCGKSYHPLLKCNKFMGLAIKDRRQLVKSNSLCFNCLGSKHVAQNCKSIFRCKECQGLHHTMIHHSNSVDRQPPAVSSVSSHAPPEASSALIARHGYSEVETLNESRKSYLPTATVNIRTADNQSITCRVLLDSGSELSYITEACAQKLGLRRKSSQLLVSGIGASRAESTRGYCTLTLTSCYSSENISISAHVLSKITSAVPSTTIRASDWDKLKGLKLADPLFYVSAPVDILIGSRYIWDILTFERIEDNMGKTIAISSIFGWVMIASVPDPTTTASLVSVVDIDKTLRNFWEIEEVSQPTVAEPDDILVETHFSTTHARDDSGRYIVQLPFKEREPSFGGTLSGAISRFHGVERRLEREPSLKTQYQTFMNQYEQLGHMAEVSPGNLEPSTSHCFYMPHHPVLGKKLRVVFDGSYRDTDGRSLNDALHIGPSKQRNIFGVCLRFRMYQFVFSADIVKMFRQIWVAPEHCQYQRIVWRNERTEPLKHYELRTVTYGTSCAPYLAIRVLEQLAEDYSDSHADAARIILEDFYVDDVLHGEATEEQLICSKEQLVQLLAEGGFELGKWVTNSERLRESLCASDTENGIVPLLEGESKVLGLFWNPSSDKLTYNLSSDTFNNSTKRCILSDMSKVFDPLGLLAPVIINFKILFQELWLHDLDWDDPIPQQLAQYWQSIRADLQEVNFITIPRFVTNDENNIELHGFSDASIKAYAAAIYCRVVRPDGVVHTTLIAAKTRVAPLKQTSLPRLELCGALLLTRLMSSVVNLLKHKPIRTVAYCDSTIVLAWLSQPPIRLKTFVGNRTSEILDTLPRGVWKHVRSKDNPADCASRGMLSSQLRDFSLWWKGPPWLQDRDLPDHNFNDSISIPDPIPEMKLVKALVTTEVPTQHWIYNIIERTSTWQKAIRIIAWVLRYTVNIRVTLVVIKDEQLPPSRWSLGRVLEIYPGRDGLVRAGKLRTAAGELTRPITKIAPLPIC